MVILEDSEPMRRWLLSNISFGDVTLGLYMLMLILINLNMVCSVRDSLCLYRIGFWMFKWVMFMYLYHEISSIFGSNTWCCCILSVSNCVLLSHRWLWWTWVMRLAREAKDGLFVHGLWCVWCLGPCGLPRVPATKCPPVPRVWSWVIPRKIHLSAHEVSSFLFYHHVVDSQPIRSVTSNGHSRWFCLC